MVHKYARSVDLAASVGRVWDWHSRPGALERLVPPWDHVRVVERHGGIGDGDRTRIEVRLGPLRLQWLAEHRDSRPGRGFTDVMLEGPFAAWTHRRRLDPEEGQRCRLTEEIDYRLRGGSLGDALAGPFVEERLRRAFAYRHRVIGDDLALHGRYLADRPNRFLVSGSTGLVGSALTALLSTGGHAVTRLLRKPPARPDPLGADHVRWDPAAGHVRPEDLGGYDVVVHLAGENVAGGPWTSERKARIRNSRVRGTALLCEALAAAPAPPRVLLCASAAGYYGDRGDVTVDESSGAGTGFLAETCAAWEEAADAARAAGIRVVHLRIGIVLTPAGGALGRLLPPFLLGMGGRLGSGRQYWSWITLDDLLGVFLHAADRDDMVGAVNAVTPGAIRNGEFARILGRVLGRPSFLPAPAAALRALLGEMADEMLLAGARIVPARLTDSDFAFRYPELEGALRHVLGRKGEGRS